MTAASPNAKSTGAAAATVATPHAGTVPGEHPCAPRDRPVDRRSRAEQGACATNAEMNTAMTHDASIERLVLAEVRGRYAVRSVSLTVYYLQAGDDGTRVLRAPGEGSPTGPYDHVFTHLIAVTSAEDSGVVAVGRRHRWDLDPEPDGPGGLLIWWISRTVTAITTVSAADWPTGCQPEPGEDVVSFSCASPDSYR